MSHHITLSGHRAIARFGALLAVALVAVAAASSAAAAPPPAGVSVHGGGPTTAAEFPWVMSLQFRSYGSTAYQRHACAGELIGRVWVLTAAHCLVGETPQNVIVGVGCTQLGSRACRPVAVRRLVVHPRYNRPRLANDIGLVRLARPLKKRRVALLRPSERALLQPGVEAISLGWGPVSNQQPSTSNRLQLGVIPLAAPTDCAQSPFQEVSDHFLNRLMICAGNADQGTCKGDSGGPLAVRVGKAWRLAGIVSFGPVSPTDPCDLGASAYTRVSFYRGFIARTTGNPLFAAP